MGNVDKFDIIANRYDNAERIELAKIISNTIRPYIIGAKNKSAIDYGCGTGLVGLDLLNSFNSMLFVDASKSMIEQVRQKIETLQVKAAKTLCCDIMTECPPDLKADYIVMVQVLLHEKDIAPLLERLFSILNKGGHLLIVDFDKNTNVLSDEVHNGFDQQELIEILKKISFLNVNSRTFYRGERIFMNQDASLFILDAEK